MLTVNRSIFLSICLVTPLCAQEIDVFQLDIDELVNVRVNISSKREQLIEDAPGIVTVISSQDINRYGAKNLHDLLRLVPGFQQIYPQFTHRSSVAIRGQIAGAIDKYFLILLNGKPLRDPILNGINAPLYEGIPLTLIDRIEIIKGPGSVVYGSNAFSGVMDIITKSETDNVITIKKGSFNSDTAEIFMSEEFEDLSVTGALRNYNTDGWRLDFIDTGRNEDHFYNQNESWGAFAEIKFKNLTLNYYKAKVTEVATLSSGLISGATKRPSDREYLALDYDFQFNEHWSVKTSLSANFATVAASTEYDAKDIVFFSSAHGDYQNLSYDVGLNLHKNELVDPNQVKVSNVTYKSVFAQVTLPLGEYFELVSGLQVVDPQESKVQYAPRVSLHSNFNNGYSAKLVYGKAYSSPTGVEFSLDLPGLFFGNRDLKPTIINNYDLQFSYKTTSMSHSLSLFHSDITDSVNLLAVSPESALPKKYQNFPKQSFNGMELETTYHPNKHMELVASYSYQSSKDENGKKDTTLLSNHIVRLGFAYQVDNLSLSLFNVFHSKVNNRETQINIFNQKEKSYSFLTFNADYKLKHLFGFNKGMNINFYIDNALNGEAIFLPDPTLTNLNTMPKIAERAYQLSFSVTF